MSLLTPLILSGGAGTRLWPLSRRLYPKQLLALTGARSLLQETAARVADSRRFAPPIVVANDEHRFMVRDQLAEIGIEPAAILLEPVGRNTAPAIALAALRALSMDPEAILAVLPSDHLVRDTDAFLAAMEQAAAAATAGNLVAFGIRPHRPETGYGYIRFEIPLEGSEGVYRIASFVEKPDLATATRYLESGEYVWNSGMFVFPAALVIEELEHFEPEMVAACRTALASADDDLGFTRIGEKEFAGAPSLPIDTAVMERTERAAVVPIDIGWNDLGAFAALYEAGSADDVGNVIHGEAVLRDSRNCYVHAEDRRLVAGVGLDGMIVVATTDAVLIVPKERADEVKELVAQLEAVGRNEPAHHRRVHRPWGTYEDLDEDDGFRVKRIVVKPGGRLSLQRHAHRSEHWVVVRGVAHVTIGDKVEVIGRNQSTYVPLREVHRLENRGDEPVHLIEVQVGDYVGEDDIERLEDVYKR